MYRHGIQKLSKEERLKFNALKKRIADVAFKKETNYPTHKKIKVFSRNESKKTLILKSGKIQSGIQIIPSIPIQESHIENLDEILESFILELALEIWRFQNESNIDKGKKLLLEINIKNINQVKEYLKHRGFRRNARKKAIQIL